MKRKLRALPECKGNLLHVTASASKYSNVNIAGNDIIITNDNAEILKLLIKVLKELEQLKRRIN